MSNVMDQQIWIVVRVQRGLVSDIRAYPDEKLARRCERSWRRQMNPDYDEIGISAVYVKPKSKSAR